MKRLLFLIVSLVFWSCESAPSVSDSGVKKASVEIQVQASGFTVEQENVKARLLEDNTPGSIKHLYVISPYSGQVIMYSTVKGKVTSSGKRLTPTSLMGSTDRVSTSRGADKVLIGSERKWTTEVLQDDGTYGSSVPYIYWWDAQGRYHQHFFTGGQIIHISDQPIAVKSITLNLELQPDDL